MNYHNSEKNYELPLKLRIWSLKVRIWTFSGSEFQGASKPKCSNKLQIWTISGFRPPHKSRKYWALGQSQTPFPIRILLLIHRYFLNLVLKKNTRDWPEKYSRCAPPVFSRKMRWRPKENTFRGDPPHFQGDSIYTTEIKSPNFEAVGNQIAEF